MLKRIVFAAALLVVKAFPSGVYFTEIHTFLDRQYTYLKYWDPYSGTSRQHQVTSKACVLVKPLK